MNTVSQIFPGTGRISRPEVGNGTKPDVPTTDRENEKKKQEIFKNFQHTSIRDENRDFGKSGKPLTKTGRSLPGLSNVANLIYSSE